MSQDDIAMIALNLEATFLGLDGKGCVTTLPVGPDFWETIDRNPAARGTLVSEQVSKTDWPHWEMHPKGDEVVYLLGGDMTLILERQSGEEHVKLQAGQAVVIPAGTWHRALVPVVSRMLFITYGEGTQQKMVDG
ncbi:MAG: cupin domain-containing protein [Alphaproteobacteria bacterium]|nr:cupin domain-containing protein [Alphaproteobacteria bacterium]